MLYPLDNNAKPGASGALPKTVLQRNELLEMAEEVASLGHWMLDLQSGSLYWSDQVYRIHDVRPEDYTPDVDSAIDFYHPEDAERVAGLLDRAISERQSFDFEFRLLRRDGEVRMVHSRARVRVDDSDCVTAVFGTFHDITVRKRAETLRRDMLALATDETLSTDAKISRLLKLGRTFLDADASFVEQASDDARQLVFTCDKYGVLRNGQSLPAQPLPASKAADLGAVMRLEEHLGRVCAWLGNAGQTRPFRHGLGLRLKINGRDYGSVWFVSRQDSCRAMREANIAALAELGQIVCYELGAHERETQLRAHAKAHERKQRELDMVLDNVPSRIWYKDGQNNILFLNREAARSVGMRREDVQGANTADVFPEMAEKYLADDLAVIESGEPRLGIVERYTPVDGEHGWVTTDKIPFVDEDSGEPRVLAVATEITGLIEAQQRMEAQAVQLRQSNRDLDQFAHIAAHDLRTPLRGMAHLVDWLGQDIATALPQGLPEGVTQKLELLASRVARMDRMLVDMLTFAKAADSTALVSESATDVNALLQDAPSWSAGHDGFTVACGEADFALLVAATPLEQLLTNLVENAVGHHDAQTGHVTIACQRDETAARITVTDDGPGIEPEHHATVFEVFATLQRRDDHDTAGIGLAVVKRVMQSLGGSVELDSPAGQRGCAFSLVFPSAIVRPLVS